jgi:exonuclease V
MKQGTQVHQALEAEIHVTVPIETPKKEDRWGLRIWNIVQGLRSLRDTGRTRELEVWGNIGGELVTGIIDELSYECPDPKLESNAGLQTSKKETVPEVPEYQRTITDFLTPASQEEGGQSLAAALAPTPATAVKEKRIYMTDIKTRQRRTLPTIGEMKPATLQLHLYHHMLENMAQGNFPLSTLVDRHGFDIEEPFSDSFIAQVGGLNQDFSDDVLSSGETEDSMDVLLQHNTLAKLWDYMISQMRQTFVLPPAENMLPQSTPQSVADLPGGEVHPTRLSTLLTVEYLSATYQHQNGDATKNHSLGSKSFIFDPQYLKDYLVDSLSWWQGGREARGVAIQEAWKCRSCEFRDSCEWIQDRNAANMKDALERKTMREETQQTSTKSEV